MTEAAECKTMLGIILYDCTEHNSECLVDAQCKFVECLILEESSKEIQRIHTVLFFPILPFFSVFLLTFSCFSLTRKNLRLYFGVWNWHQDLD